MHGGAIAAGADAALFREDGRDEDAIVADRRRAIRRGFAGDRGKQRVLVIKAEGVEVPCTKLVRRLTELLERRAARRVDPRDRAGSSRARREPELPRSHGGVAGSRSPRSARCSTGETDQMVAWQTPLRRPAGGGGVETPDRSVTRWPLATVLEETARLMDGRAR